MLELAKHQTCRVRDRFFAIHTHTHTHTHAHAHTHTHTHTQKHKHKTHTLSSLRQVLGGGGSQPIRVELGSWTAAMFVIKLSRRASQDCPSLAYRIRGGG